MALTTPGSALRLRLPRWDDHVADRLQRAGIGVVDAPGGYVASGVEVELVVEGDPVEIVTSALRGWTVLLPSDFARAA